MEVNTTTPTLPLQITLQPMSYMKFSLLAAMTASFNEATEKGTSSSSEIDEIKRMLVETNPYFLILTAAVTMLHML